MNNDNREAILIEKYLDGSLTGGELETFMQRMESDPEFRKEVEVEKILRLVLQEKDVMDFREELRDISALLQKNGNAADTEAGKVRMIKNADRHKSISIFSGRNLLMAAASVAVLISLAYVLLHLAGSRIYTNDRLFTDYYQTYPADHLIRSNDTPLVKEDSAMMFYSTGEFAASARLFGQLAGIFPGKTAYRFYWAMSLIETGEFDNAAAKLENTDYFRESEFYEQSLWYLALVQLKRDNNSQAKALLKTINDNRYYNHDQALKLLKSWKE